MGGLLKFLLIAIAVLWLVRVVARLLFPWAMRKMAEKVMGDAQRRQYQQTTYQGANPNQHRQPDGKIRIEYMPPQSKSKNGAKKAGEFVEFEEIKSPAE